MTQETTPPNPAELDSLDSIADCLADAFEDGDGAVITLLFPKAAALAAEEPGADRSESRGDGEYVLVVEDDPAVRTYLSSQLRTLGYRVKSAADAREALMELEHARPDLLFTDVVMPGDMNGGELADHARRLFPDLKVLFTSGYAQDALVEGGRLRPDVHLLGKPYRRSDLASKLREVLAATP